MELIIGVLGYPTSTDITSMNIIGEGAILS